VIQDFDRLTILDSLFLAVASHRDERPYATVSDDELWRRHADEVTAYTERFGLGTLNRFAMSAGEKKLIDIIRCLLLKPKILLLDEPTAGLPRDVRDAVIAYICELARAGEFSVVIVEHDLDVIWTQTDYVHFMAEGEVVLQGEPAWIRQHETVIEKYLGASHARS
jgi:ABC-type branched-subunit amino acid transport system ATPase component